MWRILISLFDLNWNASAIELLLKTIYEWKMPVDVDRFIIGFWVQLKCNNNKALSRLFYGSVSLMQLIDYWDEHAKFSESEIDRFIYAIKYFINLLLFFDIN